MAMNENAAEDTETINRTKMFHGIFKHQLVTTACDEDENDGVADEHGLQIGSFNGKKKKSKTKDSHWSKKQKTDPNAPSISRVPLPELSDASKLARQHALTEISRRVRLSPEKPPSICFYTLTNAATGVCCCEISEDSSLLSAGFNDSTIRIWSINGQKIKPLKKTNELNKLDKESGDDNIMEGILDDDNVSSRLTFIGHGGPVYNTSFNLDRKLLLSCSEDATVRLWSLYTWTNVVVYRLCDLPIWDVKFGPYGYYFATGGSDKCALLWTLDRQHPLRMFVGHESDVNCVNFHPNCNYIVSGSDDKSVRVWDMVNGECVRRFDNHTGAIQAVQFSNDGRLLAAGGSDGRVTLWDVGQGKLLADFASQHDDQPVYSLEFSRDNSVLASGGADDKISLCYLASLHTESFGDAGNAAKSSTRSSSVRMGDFYTKSTSILHLHFTRRNLLLAAGNFNQ